MNWGRGMEAQLGRRYFRNSPGQEAMAFPASISCFMVDF
jgi:hypothetical protein